MSTISEKFAKLGVDNAPGQEGLQKKTALDLREALRLLNRGTKPAESRPIQNIAERKGSGRVWQKSWLHLQEHLWIRKKRSF